MDLEACPETGARGSHRFLDEALEEAEASDKSRAIFRAIYKSATAVVRVSLPGGGGKVLTDPFPVDIGAWFKVTSSARFALS